MYCLPKEETIVLNKNLILPTHGIICAHPGRVKRIAEEFLTDVVLHTDYRGYKVYTGNYQSERVFVANTGIGAPAAAFLIEELVSFGVKRIIRLGSDDAKFGEYCIKLVERTTLPIGLAREYGYPSIKAVSVERRLKTQIICQSVQTQVRLIGSSNRHIDGYYVVNFGQENCNYGFTSSDMESGALYLLGRHH